MFFFPVCLIYIFFPLFVVFGFSFKHVSIVGLSIPVVLYFVSPDFSKLFLDLNYIVYFIICFLGFLFLVFSKKYFPENESVDISRFDLSSDELKAFLAHDKAWNGVLSELQHLKSLDLNKRKDGKYSEKSLKGKRANERIAELDRKHITYVCEDASFLKGVDKFSIRRTIRELLQNVVFCILIFMLVSIVFVQVYFKVPISIFGIINVVSVSILSFVSVFYTFGAAEKKANELENMVRERYVNGQP